MRADCIDFAELALKAEEMMAGRKVVKVDVSSMKPKTVLKEVLRWKQELEESKQHEAYLTDNIRELTDNIREAEELEARQEAERKAKIVPFDPFDL